MDDKKVPPSIFYSSRRAVEHGMKKDIYDQLSHFLITSIQFGPDPGITLVRLKNTRTINSHNQRPQSRSLLTTLNRLLITSIVQFGPDPGITLEYLIFHIEVSHLRQHTQVLGLVIQQLT